MKTLRTIADMHPENIAKDLHKLLTWNKEVDLGTTQIILNKRINDMITTLSDKPYLAVENIYWHLVTASLVLSEFKGTWREVVVNREIEKMKRLYALRFREIGKYGHIAQEGTDGANSLLSLLPGTTGVTYLDKDNNHFEMLRDYWVPINAKDNLAGIIEDVFPGEGKSFDGDTEQKNREQIWVDYITQIEPIEDALLIVGADHAKNKWGLVDKLYERDIKIEIITDCQEITDAIDAKYGKLI